MFDNTSGRIELFHGSRRAIPKPEFGLGNPRNDYGLGFYCTESSEMAYEWACPTQESGVVNHYTLRAPGLICVDLESPEFSTLNWLAVLLDNRRFDVSTPLMGQVRELLLERFLPDLSGADIVAGYRADDSYFKFARAFLDGRISLEQLELAMRLGELGSQVMLKSRKAFDSLEFMDSSIADGEVWHAKRIQRDHKARRDFDTLLKEALPSQGTFALDIVRGGL